MLPTMIITVGHTEAKFPTITQVGHATNSTIRHAQSQRNKTKHDGRESKRKPYDKAKRCWTTRGRTKSETTDSKQYMESIDATTSATATTYGIQHYATTHDATTDDATTDYSTTYDADAATATDGN